LAGSGLTRATVAVMGKVLTGTWRVSAFTFAVYLLGETLMVVTAAVQVSVTGLSSVLTLLAAAAPPGLAGPRTGLLGALTSLPPLTSPVRSVLPTLQAKMGTWTEVLTLTSRVTSWSSREDRSDAVLADLLRGAGRPAELDSSRRRKAPTRISCGGWRHLRRKVRIFLR
jgi:hypothetical protein